jgi:2-methylcitrate dehydratase PrpD
LDAEKASRLVTEFTAVVHDTAEPDQLESLRIRILDTMTANRLSMLQASRLIALVLRKIEGTEFECRRIMPDGTDAPILAQARREAE